ncbi:hypothetical protein QR680_017835 [Steinernema hermaphroditum]|uniref:Protein SHQ1 homolog n=1 Tax=Steinernema hermaphroditum TaxID=289476 RepID=A0AA39LPU4_9BILA|nr:hypothetical protein QR680_017835 [Steinernema hermaphroditum]
MITPSFSITQDGSFLTIRIHAPYTNIADCEIEYSEQLFYFSSAPYFLRLHLPCEVIDDDRGTSAYDVDSGYITVTVPKKNEGDHFPNLDMLTELLKAPTVSAKPVVEEISEEGADEVPDEELYAEQKMPEPEIPSEISTFGYGFGWKRHGLFSKFDDEIVKKLISLSTSPESFPISDRVGCCVQITASEFNDEHYLADKMEPPEGLQSVKDFVIVPSKNFEITQEDRDRMKDLPRRVIPPVDNVAVAYSLIDILAGYLYDYRFNEGDESVESGWTISQLSPSLTFLVKWRLAQEAVIGFARRAVTKPLYRSWELLKIVLKDTVATFRAGKSAILHCLLQIQRIMNTSGDFRYLFNDLFITDYCLWIQSLDDAVLKQVTGELEEAVKCLKKADIDCDLEELDLQTQMLKVSLNASGRSLDEEDTSGLRSVLLDSDDEELDSDDEKAV